METELLTAFLESLPPSAGFDEDTYELFDVRVDDQVSARNGETLKYPDLVLNAPGEWLLVVELKFSAAETGTEFYANAPRIGDQRIGNYESGCYCLYLHQHDEPTASSDAFANWTWRSFVTDILDRVITESAPRYPQRTTTQLHDLRTITIMTDDRTADEEKIALLIDHAEAIYAVASAFNDAWETYSEQWDRRLADHLATDESLFMTRHRDADYPAVVVTREDEEERWILRATGGDWQHLHTDGWHKANDFFEAYTTAPGTAFEELVVDRLELIEVLTETFDEALEAYADVG